MRATTLTSMTVLALLWQTQFCAAQAKPPESTAKATVQSDTGTSKRPASRLGSLSPDESRRAARARARAAATLKKSEPVRAVATAPAKPTEQAKAPEQAKPAAQGKTIEATKKTEPLKTTGQARATEQAKSTETTKSIETAKTSQPAKAPTKPEAVASKPATAAQAEHVAAQQPDPTMVPTTGRSATVDTTTIDARSAKRAIRTAERKRKAQREARRRMRDRDDRYANDSDQPAVPSRFYRVGPGGPRVVVADGPGYAGPVVVAPPPPWRHAPGPAYVMGYPPYPQPYGDPDY